MNDDRSVLPGFWDGVAGGACVGISLFTVLYLGIHVFFSVIR